MGIHCVLSDRAKNKQTETTAPETKSKWPMSSTPAPHTLFGWKKQLAYHSYCKRRQSKFKQATLNCVTDKTRRHSPTCMIQVSYPKVRSTNTRQHNQRHGGMAQVQDSAGIDLSAHPIRT